MATVYKTLLNDDVVTTRTLLHESIPITGSILSGTYDDANIKTFSHGRFQSVYDYNWTSSSANHIFDISVGYSADSSIAGQANNVDESKKNQMYNQLAQMLVGHDITGSILKFDRDGNILAGGDKLKECVFLSFSRLLTKDEIKKGSVQLEIYSGSYLDPQNTNIVTISDYGAADEFRINSPAGEYGILYTGSAATAGTGVGLVYYQAGIMVLTASLFREEGQTDYLLSGAIDQSISAALTGSSADDFSAELRRRVKQFSFNNTVELNSTVYFCRLNHNEFNYSSNPTYLQDSKIIVKGSDPMQSPSSYVTTIGLYSSDNELLATAKLSEPLKKTPENEIILRVRLDY